MGGQQSTPLENVPVNPMLPRATDFNFSKVTGSEFMPREQANAALQQILAACAGKTVIMSGAGGGADCFGAALLFNRIRSVAAKTIIANLGFIPIDILAATARPVGTHKLTFKVMPGLELDSASYYSEARMATALNHPVYSFQGGKMSVQEIVDAHHDILANEGIDINDPNGLRNVVLFLIDGGCDILLHGTETGLATPIEDMLHLRAVYAVYKDKCAAAFIGNIGANVDAAHGVVEEEMMQRMYQLRDEKKALLYADVMTPECPDAVFYRDMVLACAPQFTIVQSLAVAAIEGHRGLYTPRWLVPRIRQNKVPIRDVTATLFLWDLWKVDIGYLDQMGMGDSANELSSIIAKFRSEAAVKRHKAEVLAKQQQGQQSTGAKSKAMETNEVSL